MRVSGSPASQQNDYLTVKKTQSHMSLYGNTELVSGDMLAVGPSIDAAAAALRGFFTLLVQLPPAAYAFHFSALCHLWGSFVRSQVTLRFWKHNTLFRLLHF